MTTTDQVRLQRVGQIAVDVTDLDRAVAFYRDKLGMRYLFQVPGMAFFDLTGLRLMLNQVDAGAPPRASIVYYRADDLEATYAALSERGVRFDGAPRKIADLEDHQLWMAFCTDSEENTLALMAEKPLT